MKSPTGCHYLNRQKIKIMLEKAQKELEKIESRRASIKNEFSRERAIWDDIAEELLDCDGGKKQKFWELVMDLYDKKYTQNENQ